MDHLYIEWRVNLSNCHPKNFSSYQVRLSPVYHNLSCQYTTIKNGGDVNIPVYSHEIYDIVPGLTQEIRQPNFLIVEGINVFQNPINQRLYMSDYFDFSLYIDAEVNNIESWYLERFQTLLELAKKDENNYYHSFTKFSKDEALSLAQKTWRDINLVNLENYIEPTRSRAELILHKGDNHKIDFIHLKK